MYLQFCAVIAPLRLGQNAEAGPYHRWYQAPRSAVSAKMYIESISSAVITHCRQEIVVQIACGLSFNCKYASHRVNPRGSQSTLLMSHELLLKR